MYEKYGKRLLDLLVSFFTVFVLFPALVIIGFLIKTFDCGPVFFIQKRVGRHGALFNYFKFRSMPVDTGDLPSDQLPNVDLTIIGRFIRRTNIDELPQLINILKGEMSLVGPRPSLASQIELIKLRKENGSLGCRPGLTGLAQIESFNGMSVTQKAHFDAEYARRITLFHDVLIIIRTLRYLLKPPPVY